MDMRETPYSSDEQKVVDYLTEICPDVGAGNDPINFLIACHAQLIYERKTKMKNDHMYKIGDKVDRAAGSDYSFPGTIVAVFEKLSGQVRYVVEDDRGILFIQSEKTIKKREDEIN